jgi:adenosylcobinamide-GDP ribazoletransferase
MSRIRFAHNAAADFLAAVQFLTRIPLPYPPYSPDSLTRAVKFFPVAGLLVGSAAGLLHLLLAPHLPRLVTALLVITFLVLITGCFHEDGLADTADGFGGGWNREQVLVILKDSRIGSYGGTALALSLLARVVLLASLPLAHILQYLITAHVLCRWTTLPLSYYLAPARVQTDAPVASQGARIARLTTRGTLTAGSVFSLAVSILALQSHATPAIAAALLVTLLSGLYYQRRLGGITGDCFGATNQLAEIAVYLTGAWIL